MSLTPSQASQEGQPSRRTGSNARGILSRAMNNLLTGRNGSKQLRWETNVSQAKADDHSMRGLNEGACANQTLCRPRSFRTYAMLLPFVEVTKASGKG